MSSEDPVTKLKEHFSRLAPDKQASGWEAMWQSKVTPWDRNAPNPALIDVLKEKKDIFGSGSPSQRKRALVPGCGKGYDVLLFASHGYNAWGLDTAPSAVRSAQELAQNIKQEPGENTVQDEQIGAGEASFLLDNFFEDEFLAKTGGAKFDVIYDYTFLCALHPDMRPKWAKRMAELLAEDGTLICLEFPLGKPASKGGPPHGLTSDLYLELFKDPGKFVPYGEDGAVAKSFKRVSATGLERIAHFKPARTHAVGSAIDMMSLWQHTKSR